MGVLIDIRGRRFGRLVVLQKISGGRGQDSKWLCKCRCGKQKVINSKSLRKGLTKSCGCLHNEVVAKIGRDNVKDQTGQRFGRLVVIKRQPQPNSKRAFWICRCDCGNPSIVASSNLTRIFSCGCYAIEVRQVSQRRRLTTHGKSSTKEYIIWVGMKSRCSPTSKSNKYHGARGVKVCKRWQKFENFLEDMGQCPPDKDSIDRYPNKNGNYEPNNCRWATWKEQAANRNKPSHRD